MTACDSGLTAEAEGCKVARIRQAGGVTCGMSVQASRCGIAVAAGNNGERDLNGIVALLIGLEVEGVFRAVCSFLWRDMRTHSRKTAWMIVGPEVRLFGAYMSRDRLLLLLMLLLLLVVGVVVVESGRDSFDWYYNIVQRFHRDLQHHHDSPKIYC